MKDLLKEVIYEDEGFQYVLSISEFREVLYLSFRKYYLSFNGTFEPSSDGITIPYTLISSSRLFHALSSLLSQAETLTEVKEDRSLYESAQEALHLLNSIKLTLGTKPGEKLAWYLDPENNTVTVGIENVD